MDKFWKWMDEKRRLSNHEVSMVAPDSFIIHSNGVIYKGTETKYDKLPKQMLIGHMMEYLLEYKVNIKDVVPFHLPIGIDGVYNWLKRAINDLDDQSTQKEEL